MKTDMKITNDSFTQIMSLMRQISDSDSTESSELVDNFSRWLSGLIPCSYGSSAHCLVEVVKEGDISLSTATACICLTDLVNGIVKPEGSRLLSSAFSLCTVLQSYEPDYMVFKTEDKFILSKYPKPVIAHMKGEVFVKVINVVEQAVLYTEYGQEKSMPIDQFVERWSGFLISQKDENNSRIDLKTVDEGSQIFLWG